MTIAHRSTLVVHGRLAMREGRLAAGRDGRHGLQIMSFEQAAVRLAGGFVRPIDDESLRAAIQAALPVTPMAELESIKALPGMIDAAADILHKPGAPVSTLPRAPPIILVSAQSRASKPPSSISFRPA